MKVKNLNHATLIECRLSGILAQIAVWRGGEYTVMDSRGYAAPWLERRAGQSAVFEAIQIDAEERLDIYQTRE
tara:strand:+ start:389 stop:607 length:219 start_codon:yes stop_codon:yes gene_type:complete